MALNLVAPFGVRLTAGEPSRLIRQMAFAAFPINELSSTVRTRRDGTLLIPCVRLRASRAPWTNHQSLRGFFASPARGLAKSNSLLFDAHISVAPLSSRAAGVTSSTERVLTVMRYNRSSSELPTGA